MKYLLSIAILLVSFFSIHTFVSAHGGEGVTADAPTLIRQAIDFVEGQDNFTMATEKVELAQYVKGADSLDMDKWKQAISSLKQSNKEQAIANLVETLKENPKTSNLVELKPKYESNTVNILSLLFGILFVLLGALTVRFVKKLPFKEASVVKSEAKNMTY